MSNTRIPKIIHLCWYGGNPIPEKLQMCIDTWEKMDGYTIMKWDESNCTFDECFFVKEMYARRKYAHVSDYYRLKALLEYGGIYLDTDVLINNSLDSLLDSPCFFNFILDSVVGTAVIGAEKGSIVIKELLDMYNNAEFGVPQNGMKIEIRDGKVISDNYFPANNYYVTYYMLNKYPDFKLNNKYQDLGDFVIYPKELFEIGLLNGSHYTVHLCDGSWLHKDKSGIKNKIKEVLSPFSFLGSKIQIIIRTKRYKKLNKTSPFYLFSLKK